MERFSRSELLFGKENMDKLKFAHVLVVGIGGVGGYVCEVLARGGVGNLSIVDFDNVSESNINRQIIALSSTIGRPKVEVMKERIFEINPNCNVLTYNVKVNKETIGRIFDDKFDFVVDAIDDLNGKILLAKTCHCMYAFRYRFVSTTKGMHDHAERTKNKQQKKNLAHPRVHPGRSSAHCSDRIGCKSRTQGSAYKNAYNIL